LTFASRNSGLVDSECQIRSTSSQALPCLAGLFNAAWLHRVLK
jgi:hypothetical protein